MKQIIYILAFFALAACNTEQKDQENQARLEQKPKSEYVTEYYPTGIKKIEGKLINGQRHGRWVYYYENGFIWSEGKYVHGKRKGYSVVYYENGRKKLAGEYKNDQKVGQWQVWNEDGTLAHEISMDEPLTKEDSLRLKNQ